MTNQTVQKANYTRHKIANKKTEGPSSGGRAIFAYEYADRLRFTLLSYMTNATGLTTGEPFVTMKPNKMGFSLYMKRGGKCVNISPSPGGFFNWSGNRTADIRAAEVVRNFAKKFGYNFRELKDGETLVNYIRKCCYPLLFELEQYEWHYLNGNCTSLVRNSKSVPDLTKKLFGWYQPKLETLLHTKLKLCGATFLSAVEGFRPVLSKGLLMDYSDEFKTNTANHKYDVVKNRKFVRQLDEQQKRFLIAAGPVLRLEHKYVDIVEQLNDTPIDISSCKSRYILNEISDKYRLITEHKEKFIPQELLDIEGSEFVGRRLVFAKNKDEIDKWSRNFVALSHFSWWFDEYTSDDCAIACALVDDNTGMIDMAFAISPEHYLWGKYTLIDMTKDELEFFTEEFERVGYARTDNAQLFKK